MSKLSAGQHLARSFSSRFLGFFDDEHEAATARELGREPKKQNKKISTEILRLPVALYLPQARRSLH